MLKFFKRNGSLLLTIIGAGGVIGTAVLAAAATPKALKSIEQAKEEKGEPLTALETVKVAGPAYIPAAISGASTIACIFGANTLNKRNQASLMSAYALLDSSYKKYKAKVDELYGKEGAKQIEEGIAKDEYTDDISPADENHLFWDTTSLRYFERTVEEVRQAEDKINQQLIASGYASLNDFYQYLKLAPMEGGDSLGWSTYARGLQYGCESIDFSHEKMVLEDGLECYMLYILTEPSLDYLDY